MESRAKYLDELILAIKTTTEEKGTTGLCTSQPSQRADPKAWKVADILLKNLNCTQISNEIFSKSLEALDLLIQKNTAILHDAVDLPDRASGGKGLFWFLTNFWKISCIQWKSPAYQWAIKQSVGRWCSLYATGLGSTLISDFIFGELSRLEGQITAVFTHPQEEATVVEALKALYVLCDWCNSRTLQVCDPLLNTNFETNKWDNYFQRVMRIVCYVLDNITLDISILQGIQIKFLTLIVNYALSRGTKFNRLRRVSCSNTSLRFAIEAVSSFLITHAEELQPHNDQPLAKLLMRLYLIIIPRSSSVDLFSKTMALSKLAEVVSHSRFEDFDTQRAVFLILFDMKRREVNESDLMDHEGPTIVVHNNYQKLQSAAVKPFLRSRQLERLRKAILQNSSGEDLKVTSFKYSGIDMHTDFKSIDMAYDSLEARITKWFEQKNFQGLVYAVHLLSKLSCCESRCIKNLADIWGPCVECDNTSPSNLILTGTNRTTVITKCRAFGILSSHFLANPELLDFGQTLLVAIVLGLRKIFVHYRPASQDGLPFTPGAFDFFKCVLNTSDRYLRIVAVPLMSFWGYSAVNDFGDSQTTLLIEFLQTPGVQCFTETLLMSWVQLTISSSGDSFDPLLVKLIDIFNSTNAAERFMMTHQLRYIAWLKNITPYRLLSPVLPSILKELGKNLKKRRQSFQRLTDFVGYPPKTILENYQKYIVPYAITQYKGDIVTEISTIMCDNEEGEMSAKKDELLRRNSRQIFAVALVKHGFFAVDTIESLFINCLPTFERSFVSAYLPDYKTLAEVLKLYKNHDNDSSSKGENENMVLCALRFLFMRLEAEKRRSSKIKLLTEWSEGQESSFQRRLTENILGVFQVFSSDMHDIEGRTTYFEKQRVINGIHFLLIHASSECLISALAQISICLQSGQEAPELQDSSLKCWSGLIKRLNQEQLSTVVDSFVPFILQNWSSFNRKTATTANEIITSLINEKRELVLNSKPYITMALVNMTGSKILEQNRTFARLVNRVLYTTDWFSEYAYNLGSKNIYLIRQVLRDVEVLLQKKQLDGSAISHRPHSDISTLLGGLLDTSYRFRGEDVKLCQKCTRIIGMIGVLDTTKNQLPRLPAQMREVYDFGDHSQTVRFLINTVNDVLVPAFWESENPTKQLFVALVMQESLKYCRLDSSAWDIQKPDLYPSEARLWARFDDTAKTTLHPLRSSLYMAQSWKEYTPMAYPSFNPKQSFKTWLKNLTLDLLKTSTDEYHPLHVFSSLIREDDGFMSENLLPYIVVDILIKADERTTYADLANNIKVEFIYIFEYDASTLNHHQIDAIKLCYETVFKVLEYCKKWVTHFKQSYSRKHGTFIIREQKYLKMIQRLQDFFEMNPFGLMAEKSLETDSFERSAFFLEQSYRMKDTRYFGNDKLLPYLQTTYAEIGDIDAVEGVLKVFSTGSVASKIEELQYSHNWGMAQQCFEALGQITGPDTNYEHLRTSGNTKMLKSMYTHQQYDQVLTKLVSLVPRGRFSVDMLPVEWISMGIECAYLDGHLSELTRWIEIVESMQSTNDPMVLLHYNFGKLMVALSIDEKNKALVYGRRCEKLIGTKFLTRSTNTTLLKARDLFMRLHAVRDLFLLGDESLSYQDNGGNEIVTSRLENVGADFEPRHFLLSIQKSFNLLKSGGEGSSILAKNYYQIAQNARMNSRPDLASSALIHALINEYPSADLEYAEILWNQGENDKAIKLVAEIHQKMEKDGGYNSRERANVYLKYTEWLDLSNNSISDQIIRQYNDTIMIDPHWSEPYYSLGLYFSRLLERRSSEGYLSNGRFESKSIHFFLLSFEKDTSRTREALPKVMTFWLNTTNLYLTETHASRKESLKKSSDEICKDIETAMKHCPIYIWYMVLTQILSRLLHAHKPSMQLLMDILLSLATEYPSHILWYISVLINSSSATRASAGRQIAEQLIRQSPTSTKIKEYSDGLVKNLTNVCMKEVKSTGSRSGRSLDKDFDFNLKLAPCSMAVPVSANLELLAPSTSQGLSNIQPFRNLISIAKISSSYKTFSSLKKPKKLNFIGSDGRIYGIMCKKEDVRQDNQYMQFSTTMDFLLSKDLDSRKRGLGITTYAVVSLREDCGLIEIVPNVTTLRSILVTKYDSMKIKYSLKALHDKWQSLSPEQKLGFFEDLLSKFPPVLYEWFLETFPDAITWYKSRNVFSRSYAVMAMVGHILGLGDRHCENILLDMETGKVLHVDFDCLFEKGKRLPIPEIVPFRLTHNLEDALGISGTEGTFRKSSQVTLKLMRDNEVALVNIIETIMYDRNMDHSLHKALKVLRNKIRGIDSRDGLLLSVAGQVETVTQESTSKENLSKMYIGWLPFW
ncbi:LADA_0C03488g1_1 [Lachancea dasiensis]|uniref:Serine/threonine-protein kinase MEC1 n=1 Tax=Lachancea dasiensis TaxID=1072105 RepID=A0A1G4IYA1_9SACH|nr:LADA_0C03488g1_1 [Lachancea dasiensis]